jgi:hypothetical protein
MVEVNTNEYEFSHGRKPRGFGSWAFEVKGDVYWCKSSQTYTDAKREAMAEARRVNAREVKVCP